MIDCSDQIEDEIRIAVQSGIDETDIRDTIAKVHKAKRKQQMVSVLN